MTKRFVGSRASAVCAGALLTAMAAAPAAAQQSDPIGRGLAAAIRNAAQTAAAPVSAVAESPAAAVPDPADAQSQADAAPAAPPKPNSGNIAVTVNFDVLPGTAYVFRGITQELDPQVTMWPSADVGFTLHSADKGLKTVAINTGVWHSLQTGSAGLDGPSNKLHYEEDYYATLTLGANKASFAITYTAYTSPNGGFGTTQEILFKVSPTYKYGPYAILAQEMAGGADAGPNKGTYLELGVAGPGWAAKNGKVSVTVPVKLGLSLHNYYEHPVTGEDHNFGFFDVGVLVSLPISKFATSYGTWNLHFGGDFLAFGETTKYFNDDNSTKGVFLVGIGFTY